MGCLMRVDCGVVSPALGQSIGSKTPSAGQREVRGGHRRVLLDPVELVRLLATGSSVLTYSAYQACWQRGCSLKATLFSLEPGDIFLSVPNVAPVSNSSAIPSR